MTDDWQSEFLTSRHVHNRQSRKFTPGNTRSSSVLQAFGLYEVQCPSAEAAARMSQYETAPYRNSKKGSRREKRLLAGSQLQINTFADNEDGLAGTLYLAGALDATIILAGSRKTLQTLVDEEAAEVDLRPEITSEISNEWKDAEAQENGTVEPPGDCLDYHPSTLAACRDEEEKSLRRFDKFEKNTFRQPKFWFAWTGRVMCSPSATANATFDSVDEELQSGMGYLVFSGSKYKKFQGTISCGLLGWKDVAIGGWKR
ncbi:Ff.00g005450.m01.CDS01 [Fusarium sp. VM40]|nr:Ff.00g005450.m01.CDS01 [Fusarium sp. VM40]